MACREQAASAAFYQRILGLESLGKVFHFDVVRVDEHLTLDFMDSPEVHPVHLAFKVSEADFDAIFGRIREEALPFGGSPRDPANGKTYSHNGGRGLYFRDPDGHVLEILTADYASGVDFDEA